MKITLISMAIFSTFSIYANDYVVVVDKEKNTYESSELREELEYTEWSNTGETFDCINKTPLSSDIYEGTDFDQDADCKQNQERIKTTYLVDSISGTKIKKSEEIENQVVDISITTSAVGSYEAISCLDIINHNGSIGDGVYSIKPKNNKLNVTCNMSDGGYTIYTMSNPSPIFTAEIESRCSAENMQLFVPRTENHLTKAVLTLGKSNFYLMGIYPKIKGASCATVYFNSDTCNNFSANDNGKWFVYNWDMTYPHGSGGFGVYPEPNGDNDLKSSLSYNFDETTGKVSSFNDIANNNPSSIGGYSATSWSCSALDEKNI